MNMRASGVVLLVVATAVMAFEVTPDMKEVAEACAKEHNVDLSAFKPGEKPDMKLFENHDYKCFGNCVSVKSGWTSDKGEPNIEKIKELYNPGDEALSLLKKCAADNKEEDVCERHFKIFHCVKKDLKMPMA